MSAKHKSLNVDGLWKCVVRSRRRMAHACTAKRIVIPMVLLHIKSRVGLISKKRKPIRLQVSEKGVEYLP